ncbi:MAG: class I SAM-dependent RNA methyltransferase [Furfurilactobacillus sp.]|jgi:putative N6-adenine-specific DNA methylase|uniref:THUMP domain-containing class I SAM-dependent RNA methyltransferase n=1 Tax=Furfurilactobacillus sp. TaxID=2767911 RepID=UPI00258CD52C|nr:class I SAM-dependent RNA methyltransferase [Furfurilactobacillus sp.]MCH4010692.1 class I SAM-dependent RNA methyltransferase [Furfurilactobacillus sp.]MCH4036584.1 class I SAM-dependent RNA methyltransferase [Furfurilactobacillus sp.]MCH4114470.1 class I SAM-dependent RNA methyltransferase [Furfurilactobacillus sp.]MCH4132707.1 class I SAM-dependent RNA methyltransferase [Furfurilactobacillus sp.]MCI1340713.1 class I SAM-dependent RNA methyltransferase [Furfurilactobacillus sp.]
MQTFQLIATCAAGIEALVGRELRDLGYETQVENGRVRFNGTVKDILRTNLWLRTADRIKIVVKEFPALTFTELFDQTEAVAWDELLPMDANFPVEGRSHNSQLHSVPDAQAIVKKAIVTQLSDVYYRRTRLPETGAKFPLEVAINKDQVMLTLDTTGDSLFKRGYRVAKGDAPLKENMAAALILLTHWTPADMPFLDPVCGSGTLPIEAALIARNIAPGYNRHFICESWPWVSSEVADTVRDEADAAADYDSEFDIAGSDNDPEMVAIAKKNAQAAGLSQDVHFSVADVTALTTDKINGVIVANPPYGERLSDQTAVRALYKGMGKAFKPLTTWSKYILTSDLDFEAAYGQRATKKRKLYNGALRTDLYQYWGKPIWHHDNK